QLREIIRNKIEMGEYPLGTAIPSESELSITYGLNKKTVRNALKLLEKEGLLKKIQGKGIYVKGEKLEKKLTYQQGFIRKTECANEKIKVKTIKKYFRKAGKYYSKLLKIDPEDIIYYVQQVVMKNGKPVSIQESFIPRYILPRIEDIELSIYSISEVFYFYKILIEETIQELEIVKINKKNANILNIENEDFILKCSGINIDSLGRKVEYFNHFSRGDILNYHVNFIK
ncbi:hypothetical protein FUSO6_06110, partial [Fusobacterium necrophorum DAB]